MAVAIQAAFLVLFVTTVFTKNIDTIVPTASKETHLMVLNVASHDIITTIVSGIDPFDWDNKRGPEGNFQDVQIKVGESAEHREEVNALAKNCPFTMTLIFADGSRDTYRINQKYAIGDADAGFEHSEGTHHISYTRVGSMMLMITVS